MSITDSEEAHTPEFVAPRQHTAILLLILIGIAAPQIVAMLRDPAVNLVGPAGRIPLYGQVLALQLLLLWFVRTGMSRRGYSVRALVDRSQWSASRWARYVAIGVAAWVLWLVFGAALGLVIRPTPNELRTVLQFLPKTLIEKLCWVGFAIGTSLCEEILYRGYLLRQFSALTGSSALALLLQACIFAIGHSSLGPALLLSVTLLALWLGALALWQKSLVPGMIAHAATGLFGGLFSPS